MASVGLTDTHDAASFAVASKRCSAVCRAAPLRLAVRTPLGASPHEEQAAARVTLQQLCASFPGEARSSIQCFAACLLSLHRSLLLFAHALTHL